MPHSSGGGGHGHGGFHGGGYHGGHRGGHYHGNGRSAGGYTLGPVVKRQPFNGGYRYMYYSFKKPRYYYANFLPQTDNYSSWKTLLIILIAVNLILYTLGYFCLNIYRHPEKLETDSEVHYIIDDQMMYFTSGRERLENDLEAFYQKTGIVPVIVTYDSTKYFNPLKGQMPSYEMIAFNEYVGRFGDESHWLIIYSRSASHPEIFNFEGMQGNDTDDILYYELMERFNSTLNRYLGDLKFHTSAESFALAFESIESDLMVHEINIKPFAGLTALALIISLAFIDSIVAAVKKDRFRRSVRVDEDATEETCMFCGGTFVKEIDYNCPFCKDDSL